MTRKTTLTLAAALAFLLATSPLLPSEAKKWTVTQRLEKISKEIDEGRAGNELTVKQVESLKKEVADIKDRMEAMKTKNADKLSIPEHSAAADAAEEVGSGMCQCRGGGGR